MDFLELCSLMRTLCDYELVRTTDYYFSVKQQFSDCVISAISLTATTLAAKVSLPLLPLLVCWSRLLLPTLVLVFV